MMETPGAHAGSHAAAPGQSVHSTPDQATDGDPMARRAQFLATEHWSLLATRSMSWNEAFARTSMFLSVLSAATVALALAGPAMAFGDAFTLFAVIVLSVALFLGIATFVRLVQVNNEDLYWVTGMNRLRARYVQLAPGIERDFVSGYSLDVEGLARSFGAFDVTSSPSVFHALLTTPAVVAVISSTIAGVIVGLVVQQLGAAAELAIGIGVVTFLVGVAASLAYGRREMRRYIARAIEARIPDAEAIDGDLTRRRR
jgi:hypothetical protein